MTAAAPRAWGEPPGAGLIRCQPDDFQVSEELGFELSGEGEHAFLYLQKRRLNTMELVQRVAALSGAAQRDIGICGLKDRNAVTRQWLSVGLAGREAPDWQVLEQDGDVQVLQIGRHTRKLRRGVHRANHFSLVLRQLQGERAALEQRLAQIRRAGVPNYFGEQRFGRGGATLEQARRWMSSSRRISRSKRSLYFSALRASVFNHLLAQRVDAGTWNTVLAGDTCMLRGSRSFFACQAVDDDISTRSRQGDIHPGLPLWGRASKTMPTPPCPQQCGDICDFLESSGLELSWRAARLMPDDFCWQFCDDGSLQLEFALGAGSYATALLAELVHYKEGTKESGIGSEQG